MKSRGLIAGSLGAALGAALLFVPLPVSAQSGGSWGGRGGGGSMSAASILTALLTVDGAASGIDSDLLDGLSSAAFCKITGDTGCVVTPVIGVDSGTKNGATIAVTTPADGSGTNARAGLRISPVIGNATAGTNSLKIIAIDACTGDAQVTTSVLDVGALTGTAASENVFNIGDGWDSVVNIVTGSATVANVPNGLGTFTGAAMYFLGTGTADNAVTVGTGSANATGRAAVRITTAATAADRFIARFSSGYGGSEVDTLYARTDSGFTIGAALGTKPACAADADVGTVVKYTKSAGASIAVCVCQKVATAYLWSATGTGDCT